LQLLRILPCIFVVEELVRVQGIHDMLAVGSNIMLSNFKSETQIIAVWRGAVSSAS